MNKHKRYRSEIVANPSYFYPLQSHKKYCQSPILKSKKRLIPQNIVGNYETKTKKIRELDDLLVELQQVNPLLARIICQRKTHQPDFRVVCFILLKLRIMPSKNMHENLRKLLSHQLFQ